MSQDENLAAVVSTRRLPCRIGILAVSSGTRARPHTGFRAGSCRRRGSVNPYLSQIERGLRKPSAEVLQPDRQGVAGVRRGALRRPGSPSPAREQREVRRHRDRHGDQRAAEAGAARHLHLFLQQNERFRRSFHLINPHEMPCRTNRLDHPRKEEEMAENTTTVEDLKVPLLAAVGAADLAPGHRQRDRRHVVSVPRKPAPTPASVPRRAAPS